MIRLSAFADEISPRLQEQIEVLRTHDIQYLDLRSVEDVNVLDLTEAQTAWIARSLAESGIGVAAIGSPIGKVPLDHPFEEHFARFERALALAHQFETPFVRIFSFYAPHGSTDGRQEAARDEVLRRLRAMTERARTARITLLHENEKDIYGDTVVRCVDLLSSIGDAHFAAAFDPANFIQCGEVPYPLAYRALLPWMGAVHVKDALPDGQVVPAGDGVARWPEILQALQTDRYDGFLSLEPHLQAAGQFRGFSGPELFARAVSALKALLGAKGIPYA